MKSPAIKLLIKLFESWQRNPESERRTTLPISKQRAIEYYDTVRPDDKDELHATLHNAETDGCVQLEWGKHHDSHLLKRIILLDGEKLAAFLGLPLATDIARAASAKLSGAVPPNHAWINQVVEAILFKWQKGEAAFRLEPGSVQDAKQLIGALGAVAANKQAGLDLRTFSAKFLGDSKYMERIKDRFAKIWNDQFETGLDANELYESLGLLKFPPAIYLKGPCRVRAGGEWIDISRIPSYIGLPPDSISEIEFTQTPGYILTIENLASFNRHTREIQDNGLIVYSAGFLGPNTSKIIKMIDKKLPSVEFFHWGDIDVGGVVIAEHVQSTITHDLKLHLMSEDILLTHGKQIDKLGRNRLNGIGDRSPDIKSLALALLDQPKPVVVEQEQIDPAVPLIDGVSRFCIPGTNSHPQA